MPTFAALRTRRALAVAAALPLALAACGDDPEESVPSTAPTSTTEATTTSITTIPPETTADLGEQPNPEDFDDQTGGTDTTLSGAVPGRNPDRVDPPNVPGP